MVVDRSHYKTLTVSDPVSADGAVVVIKFLEGLMMP